MSTTMQRRDFIRGAGAAAACLNPRGASARVPPTVLRLGFTGTRTSNIGSGAIGLCKRLEDLCGERFRVDPYPAGEAGGEAECLQDVRSGALDMVYGSSAAYIQLSPALGIFDIPFLFRNVAHARAVLDGPIGQEALGTAESAGVVALAWGENGLRHVTSAVGPVRKASDLVGLKLRVPQSPVMLSAFRAMGAAAQPLPYPDLYAALASGDFQAQENSLVTIQDGQFYRVQRFLSLTGHAYSAALFVIGKRVYDRLSPEDARALRNAAAAGVQASRASADLGERTLVDSLRNRGMAVSGDIDRASFVEALSGVRKEFEKQFGAARIAAIQQDGH